MRQERGGKSIRLIVDLEDAEIVGNWPVSSEISTIVTTYNHEFFIDECIDSIISQESVDNHIVIHDDHSTDGTRQILLKLQNKYPNNITLILQNCNQRSNGQPILARLMTLVNSDFIAICEGDDFWTDTKKLEIQLSEIKRDVSIGLVFHDVNILNTSGKYEHENALRSLLDKVSEDNFYTFKDLSTGNFIMTCSVLIRKDSIRVEFLHSMYKVSPGDWLIYSMISESARLVYINKKMCTYRIHASNMWANSPDRKAQEINTFEALWFMASRIVYPKNNYFKRTLMSWLWHGVQFGEEDNPLVTFRTQLQNTETQLQNTETQLQNTETQLQNLMELNLSLSQDLENLYQSRSWKVTYPLRKIVSKVRLLYGK